MKTTRTVLILMVLDLMAFFSILKIVDSNNMLWGIEVVLAVGIIPLLYSAIGSISKALLVQAEEFIKLMEKERQETDIKFSELIKENENFKEAIIDAFKNLNDNQNSICEKISGLQSETIKSIQALTNKNEDMNKNINELIIKEQEFINVTFNNSNALKENYENLDKFFKNSSNEFKQNFAENYSQLNKLLEEQLNRISTKVNSSIEKTNDFLNDFSNLYTKFTDELKENEIRNFEQIKEITSGKIDEMQHHLVDNNSKMQENISGMALLFDDTLNRFEEKVSETIENYTYKLSKDIGKDIKDIHKKLVEDNGEWKQITEEYSDKNTEVINQIHELIQKMSNLHNNLLKQIDENQKKMMHLNESDIKLMKDMMK